MDRLLEAMASFHGYPVLGAAIGGVLLDVGGAEAARRSRAFLHLFISPAAAGPDRWWTWTFPRWGRSSKSPSPSSTGRKIYQRQ